jgi:hypothetical protein
VDSGHDNYLGKSNTLLWERPILLLVNSRFGTVRSSKTYGSLAVELVGRT